MPGLPTGWEADYDGKRWFYTYLPSGHVQYHFPSEGDEFPDFIDVSFPAPALAPEERLESQQQVKRQAGGVRGLAVPPDENKDNGMTASARPVSAVWDESEVEETVYQPETFMFLGPVGYSDVSPLVEEEDGVVKKVADGEDGGGGEKVVSPEQSATTTPSMKKSGVSLDSSPAMWRKSPKTDFIISEAVSPAPSSAAVSPPQDSAVPLPASDVAMPYNQPIVQTTDSRNVAVELSASPHDPVGKIPEMASGETAKAYIEVHPDPVEIADNTILAPIETTKPSLDGWAELPNQDKTAKTAQGYPSTGEVKGSPASSISIESGEVNVATELKYKPFKPGQAQATRPRSASQEVWAFQASLQRERSLLMGLGSRPEPVAEGTQSVLLKPGPRNGNTSSLASQPPLSGPEDKGGQSIEREASPAFAKYPSILRPARGRALSQPTSDSSPAVPTTPTSSEPAAESPQPFSQTQPLLSYERPAKLVLRPGPPLPPKIPTSTTPSTLQPTTLTQSSSHVSRAGSTVRKAVPVKTEAPLITSPQSNPIVQNRRHSSFSPLDLNGSRRGSMPQSAPQSPPEGIRRGSSAVSLAQSLSHAKLFTPSPKSLTPASGAQLDEVSPMSGRLSQPHLRSGSEQGSYFTAADAGRTASPGQLFQRSQSVKQSPPAHYQAPDNGTRPNRMSMQASPSAVNLLNSIQERDETHLLHCARPLGPSNRHSMTSAFPFSQFGQLSDTQKLAQESRHHQICLPGHPNGQHVQSQAPAAVHTAPYPLSSDMRPEPVAQPRESSQNRLSAQSQALAGRLSQHTPASIPSQPVPQSQTWNQQDLVPATAAPTKEKGNKFKKWFKSSKPSAPAETQVPPAGHPHAPPSGWHANASTTQSPKLSDPAGGAMPWSPGQIHAATFAQSRWQSTPHHPAEGAPPSGAPTGPNVLHKQRPGCKQQVQRPRVDHEHAATSAPSGAYQGSTQCFGGPPNGQGRPESLVYGSAVDL